MPHIGASPLPPSRRVIRTSSSRSTCRERASPRRRARPASPERRRAPRVGGQRADRRRRAPAPSSGRARRRRRPVSSTSAAASPRAATSAGPPDGHRVVELGRDEVAEQRMVAQRDEQGVAALQERADLARPGRRARTRRAAGPRRVALARAARSASGPSPTSTKRTGASRRRSRRVEHDGQALGDAEVAGVADDERAVAAAAGSGRRDELVERAVGRWTLTGRPATRSMWRQNGRVVAVTRRACRYSARSARSKTATTRRSESSPSASAAAGQMSRTSTTSGMRRARAAAATRRARRAAAARWRTRRRGRRRERHRAPRRRPRTCRRTPAAARSSCAATPPPTDGGRVWPSSRSVTSGRRP